MGFDDYTNNAYDNGDNGVHFLLFGYFSGKKHRQIKLQPLQKVRIWAFGLLVYQINSL